MPAISGRFSASTFSATATTSPCSTASGGGRTVPFHLCHHSRLEFARGDVRDRSLLVRLLASADVIIPLAAIVGAPACDRDPQTATAVNLDAIRMLNSLRSPDQLVIYPVTNSGYGTKSGEVYCTEDTPLEPISAYGRMKVQTESELLATPRVITLRFAAGLRHVARGCGLDLLVNHFVYAAMTDGYLVLFEKDFKRNFLHIRDAADCFCHCIEHADGVVGRPFNVGLDDANLSKDELAHTIKKHLPDFAILSSEIRGDPDERNYIVSNQHLREAGFVARRSLDDGIRELIKGYSMLPRSALGNV